MTKYNFLIETEMCYYCKIENLNKLKMLEEFVPMSHYLENADVLPAYFNVVGYIREKAVLID
ncbi:MAG: hypothetical protein IKJ72_03035 [Mycoplasmataceae bacterium]|nr:hypothetical protein [Mycoplasmataceae bacterium]